MSDSIEQKNDHQYKILIYEDTLNFYLEALKYYLELLHVEIQKINSKAHLKSVLGEYLINDSALDKEEKYISGLAEAIENTITNWSSERDLTFIDIAHKDVRIIKAVGMIFLEKLKDEKQELINQKVSEDTLKHLEYKIVLLRNKLNSGVFQNATPWNLLVGEPQEKKIIVRESYETVVHCYEIEIIDSTLRKRCLDLYDKFTAEGCTDRYDTVLTEATRILEDRIRQLADAPVNKVGPELATYAFGGDKPKLKLSNSKAEQEGLHLLYRGVFGWIRNPVHHRLVPNLQKERVLQLLCLVDYLLSLAEEAYTRSMINGDV